jgi:hypothetical protein
VEGASRRCGGILRGTRSTRELTRADISLMPLTSMRQRAAAVTGTQPVRTAAESIAPACWKAA